MFRYGEILTGWWKRRIPDEVTVMILAAVTGIVSGALASSLKYILALVKGWVWNAVPSGTGDWALLVMPAAGIMLAMIYQRYLVHEDLSHGTSKISALISQPGECRIRPSVIWNSVLACGVTVGSGSSAGSEGPLAYSGAAFGSCMSRWCGLSPYWIRLMVGIGAGAGIAGIFKVPIGGTLFTLEVLQMDMGAVPVMALITACVMASITAFLMSGYAYDWAFEMEAPFDPASLGWIALLGVFCGLYAVWYSWSKERSDIILRRIGNPWIKALLAGSLMSAAVWLIPVLYGEGCDVIQTVINGGAVDMFTDSLFHADNSDRWLLYLLICVMLLVKGPLVAGANSGGGVAGDFVPALFIGGIAGYLFGLGVNGVFGVGVPVWYMSLAGMGAVFACSNHAPLMSLFLMCETTNSFQYMPAYLLAITVAYLVMMTCRPKSRDRNTSHDTLHTLWKAVVSCGGGEKTGCSSDQNRSQNATGSNTTVNGDE